MRVENPNFYFTAIIHSQKCIGRIFDNTDTFDMELEDNHMHMEV